MLKHIPPYDKMSDHDSEVVCDVVESFARVIYDDDELSEAFQSYFMRKGKPRVQSYSYGEEDYEDVMDTLIKKAKKLNKI
jgi:hypothetical protein